MVVTITHGGVGGGIDITYDTWDGVAWYTEYFSYCWNGHSFNPHEPWQGCTCCWCFVNDGWPAITDAASTFPVTGLQPGHELVMSLGCFSNLNAGDVYGMKYIGTGMSCTQTATAAVAGVGFYWFGVGLRFFEITCGGNYCSYAIASGATCVCCQFTVCTFNHNDWYSGNNPGYLWIDGENLYFTSCWFYKHCVKNDGSTYGSVSTDYAGEIWVPDTANAKYLMYVDESGDIRRTVNGDTLGWRCCDQMPGSGLANGYLWTPSSSDFNRHALFFINYSGQKVRLGNGFRDDNCY